ncbi:hypothetical protein EZL74_05950 [Flavobacterium silvisoli]|uniref:DUF3828 domain-containing protein n=1 Tax=Flavobacterium silvisoli TaxID=2529433 RepID=A0A4Q9Z0Z2_9FLAO|nr:hypothetical protein [Flavobacterium silvisoli]TBX69959.1 hypothetical protein EZL74_05950 [Flavobacterium silvisoli]
MRTSFIKILFTLLLTSPAVFSQESDNAVLLKIIFTKYYKNEKVIAKERLQLLSFYCKKAPNNEEVLEVIAKNDVLKKNADEIKKQIDITIDENWSKEYNILFDNQNQYLKSKVNACLSFEEYKIVSDRFGLNNQRLMIVSKPIYFDKSNFALVKVAFYRNIEHNSGSYLLFEKVNGVWTIKEYLNEWAT